MIIQLIYYPIFLPLYIIFRRVLICAIILIVEIEIERFLTSFIEIYKPVGKNEIRQVDGPPVQGPFSEQCDRRLRPFQCPQKNHGWDNFEIVNGSMSGSMRGC